MRVFNENKTYEMSPSQIDLEKGYLKPDKIFIAHHEAVKAAPAVYKERVEKLPNGSTQIWKDLVSPAVESKAAWDKYEDIQVYVSYSTEEIRERRVKNLRRKREVECFPIINRGQLWYDELTEKQKAELKEWYQNWLQVTETFEAPDKLKWLK